MKWAVQNGPDRPGFLLGCYRPCLIDQGCQLSTLNDDQYIFRGIFNVNNAYLANVRKKNGKRACLNMLRSLKQGIVKAFTYY